MRCCLLLDQCCRSACGPLQAAVCCGPWSGACCERWDQGMSIVQNCAVPGHGALPLGRAHLPPTPPGPGALLPAVSCGFERWLGSLSLPESQYATGVWLLAWGMSGTCMEHPRLRCAAACGARYLLPALRPGGRAWDSSELPLWSTSRLVLVVPSQSIQYCVHGHFPASQEPERAHMVLVHVTLYEQCHPATHLFCQQHAGHSLSGMSVTCAASMTSISRVQVQLPSPEPAGLPFDWYAAACCAGGPCPICLLSARLHTPAQHNSPGADRHQRSALTALCPTTACTHLSQRVTRSCFRYLPPARPQGTNFTEE